VLLPKRTLLIGGAIAGVAYMYSLGIENPSGAAATTGGATCRVTITADVLNVRSAPDAKAGLVGKFKKGAETDADSTVQNGFRKIGANRWASAEFLQPMPGRTC
jgi:hypothetical protein